jgi:hypothetical protein
MPTPTNYVLIAIHGEERISALRASAFIHSKPTKTLFPTPCPKRSLGVLEDDLSLEKTFQHAVMDVNYTNPDENDTGIAEIAHRTYGGRGLGNRVTIICKDEAQCDRLQTQFPGLNYVTQEKLRTRDIFSPQ